MPPVTEIPENIFGGMYYDENKNIVINVTEIPTKNGMKTTSKSVNGVNIRYNIVDKTLAELEAVHQALVPYMAEFGIMSLDANDVTNKIDIVLYQDHAKSIEEVEELVSQFIDLKYVTVSVLEKNLTVKPTVLKTPIDLWTQSIESQSVEPRSTYTIYPGTEVVKVDSTYAYSYTAGPKISSTKFYTAGHAAYDIFNPSIYNNLGLLIGSQGSLVFGPNGDEMKVTISNTYNFSLPSTNKFVIGSGVYSYWYTSNIVGEDVDMHGSKSGISSGTVQLVNQTVYLVDYDVTVGNLALADYTCRQGDSGAGVFDANAHLNGGYCYGIQSMGIFVDNSDVSLCSYFSLMGIG